MSEFLNKAEYENVTAASRDERMQWWREARFGMFIHFGLYSLLGRHEWAMALENNLVEEYETLAQRFNPKEGVAYEWAKLAKSAGMKYIVLTTRHHEGFSLWDSKVNPYNSVNYGPKRDLVAEFVDACRKYDLKIGFYSSLMDWHHPDGWKCAYDLQARIRFCDYITSLNYELMTQYGKIDILWYDVPQPLQSYEGWNSLERNQMIRRLQPHILINNRSRLDEDFGTPEEHISTSDRDWEACMTFNGISWGYLDSAQAEPYSYNAHRIVRMLNTVTAGGGNLLLNVGPAPDGSIPSEAIQPLTTVGNWLSENGEAVYGSKQKSIFGHSNGVCGASYNFNTVYLWNWIWPNNSELRIGGFSTKLRSARIVTSGKGLDFEQNDCRILIKNLPEKSPDTHLGITIIALEFQELPDYKSLRFYPHFQGLLH